MESLKTSSKSLNFSSEERSNERDDSKSPIKDKKGQKLDLSSAWDIASAYYNLEEIVGEGSYGQVIKGKCKKTSREVAIKFIQNVCESDYDCVKVIREIQLLRKLTEIPNNVHTVELIDLLMCPKESNN